MVSLRARIRFRVRINLGGKLGRLGKLGKLGGADTLTPHF